MLAHLPPRITTQPNPLLHPMGRAAKASLSSAQPVTAPAHQMKPPSPCDSDVTRKGAAWLQHCGSRGPLQLAIKASDAKQNGGRGKS